MLKHFLTGLYDLVYPPHCPICRKHLTFPVSDEIICPDCRDALIRNTPPFCPKCSRHLGNSALPRCLQCRNEPYQFDFAWAACLYKDPLRDLIIQFKYYQKTRFRKPFTRCVTEFVQTYNLDIQQFDCIIPVPLHPVRFRERGYNQALLLAERIATAHQIPLSAGNLVRKRNTKQQTLLSEKERWTNMRGAFRINQPAGFFRKNILIIDDLLTTGATVSEVAGELKRAGAGTVGVLTLAITS